MKLKPSKLILELMEVREGSFTSAFALLERLAQIVSSAMHIAHPTVSLTPYARRYKES